MGRTGADFRIAVIGATHSGRCSVEDARWKTHGGIGAAAPNRRDRENPGPHRDAVAVCGAPPANHWPSIRNAKGGHRAPPNGPTRTGSPAELTGRAPRPAGSAGPGDKPPVPVLHVQTPQTGGAGVRRQFHWRVGAGGIGAGWAGGRTGPACPGAPADQAATPEWIRTPALSPGSPAAAARSAPMHPASASHQPPTTRSPRRPSRHDQAQMSRY